MLLKEYGLIMTLRSSKKVLGERLCETLINENCVYMANPDFFGNARAF